MRHRRHRLTSEANDPLLAWALTSTVRLRRSPSCRKGKNFARSPQLTLGFFPETRLVLNSARRRRSKSPVSACQQWRRAVKPLLPASVRGRPACCHVSVVAPEKTPSTACPVAQCGISPMIGKKLVGRGSLHFSSLAPASCPGKSADPCLMFPCRQRHRQLLPASRQQPISCTATVRETVQGKSKPVGLASSHLVLSGALSPVPLLDHLKRSLRAFARGSGVTSTRTSNPTAVVSGPAVIYLTAQKEFESGSG